MRKQSVLFSILLVFFISSCKLVAPLASYRRFDSNRDTLYLQNGQIVTGYVEIDMERSAKKAVRVYAPETKTTTHYLLSQVQGYTVGSDHYLLKEVNKPIEVGKGHSLLGQLVAGKAYLFMKQLTPAQSRMHVYESVEKQAGSSTASYVTTYYVALPGESENKVYPLDDSRLVPHFDVKMSRIVSDCPALAQKIAQNTQGYTYAQLNLLKEKQLAVLLNIIEEYNSCN